MALGEVGEAFVLISTGSSWLSRDTEQLFLFLSRAEQAMANGCSAAKPATEPPLITSLRLAVSHDIWSLAWVWENIASDEWFSMHESIKKQTYSFIKY